MNTLDKNIQVTVLGAGAWGTSFATLLAHNGHNVKLWCFEQNVAHDIQKHRINHTYLPNVTLSPNIHVTSDLAEALRDSTWVFEAVPVAFLRKTLTHAQSFIHEHQKWVVLSKGIERDTFLLPSQIIQDVLGVQTAGVIAGPNFAKELAQQAYTATTVASHNPKIAEELAALLANNFFKPYISDDMIGAQVGGAIKNVFALAIGMGKGSELHENTIAFILTQALQEIALIIEFFGGKKETVYGLSGVGDLLLTCTSPLSKNFQAGLLLGKNSKLADIEKVMVLPEGINTTQSIYQIIKKNNLNVPLCRGVYEVIFHHAPVETIFKRFFE